MLRTKNTTSRRDALRERAWAFETYEERLALSAAPVADFWIDYDAFDAALEAAVQDSTEPSSAYVMPLAAEGHGWTDVAAARSDFGLRGGKQTVAIIDSGIAWDHIALGGGLGKAHRVVGGWDFAENDANPYDDGPGGFHGTHVAGIVGANDSRYAGVASDVDLVGIRVFDDQGNGYFTWVEQALRWVHSNRNAFDNPITTVNLSLGTEWNANTLPQWATLEDELQQLSADGIFVSVAAGNSFLVYNAVGLSYPAVSQYVTPVGSVDAQGNLSRFSQRHDRMLAAPGERIMSTLPDHFYGGDGNKNDWGATSGTSMAAPYVAGASVLAREAMQNLGFTNITQGTIYDLFRSTADTVFDAATNATYRRLNLGRALETLVGADDFAGAAEAAGSLGKLQTTQLVSGTIGRLSDQDFFRFTAGATGQVTLTLTSPEHLSAAWKQVGGQGRIEGNKLTLDVVSGQTYTVGVGGGGVTIGKYQVDLKLTAITPPNQPVPPTAPTQPQPPTRQPPTPQPPSPPSGNPVGAAIVVIAGTTARITGTAGNDTFEWRGEQSQLVVNGVSYSLAGMKTIKIDAGGGSDSLTMIGTSAAETAVLRPGMVDLFASRLRLSAENVETSRFVGDALDRAWLYDSAGNDTLEATPSTARLSGPGYASIAEGCGTVVANSQAGGQDTVHFIATSASDVVDRSVSFVRLRGGSFNQEARGFEQVQVQRAATGLASTAPPAEVAVAADAALASAFADIEDDLAAARLRCRLAADRAAADAVYRQLGHQH